MGQVCCTLKRGWLFFFAAHQLYPYNDLLLHEIGPELDDGATEGSAETYEWRTPPLWGLGLSPNSQGGSYFLMHDGRTTSIEDAILLHGGEATDSRAHYESLSAEDNATLLRFLKSLLPPLYEKKRIFKNMWLGMFRFHRRGI
ncbi:di-heme oxidoredictase family protein [Algoriphagus persicinus]|uniref:di-heme oxidoredictase family protein n=1 Tax=Algoriphagus persicinus TaxID=3108754 RepID=UPI002B3B0126|nr:di-heme oxidoredictase family protein [Algoriphagus sp. E1-3-M2]MEB2786370.1 di-heme oxidoredictase family protein [Algoriphagus sp. E1-3-M2]